MPEQNYQDKKWPQTKRTGFAAAGTRFPGQREHLFPYPEKTIPTLQEPIDSGHLIPHPT